MNIEYRTRFRKPSLEELALFERDRGIELPISYKEYLRLEGGGFVQDNSGYFADGLGREWLFETVCGYDTRPHSSARYDSIYNRGIRNLRLETARPFVRFAYEPNGDPYVMDLRPQGGGRIWLVAHDTPPNDPPLLPVEDWWEDYELLEARLFHPVAPSFEAFLAMHAPMPEELRI